MESAGDDCTFRCEVRGYSAALAGKLATSARISRNFVETNTLAVQCMKFCDSDASDFVTVRMSIYIMAQLRLYCVIFIELS